MSATSHAFQRYKIGTCPACQAELYIDATLEIGGDRIGSPPDPRAEGKITLAAKILGAILVDHDCRKKATR